MKERPKKRITKQHLVSLNTARIKLKNQHPRISKDLKHVFDILKIQVENDDALYKDDGYIDID